MKRKNCDIPHDLLDEQIENAKKQKLEEEANRSAPPPSGNEIAEELQDLQAAQEME
jgi:hypothetical protein